MAIQAQWHTILFEGSSRWIRTFKSLDTEIGLEYERNDDTEGKSATQTVRRKLQKISFSYEALASLGVWPKREFEAWTDLLAQGIHAPFYINGESFNGREFIITNVKMSSEVINQSGFIVYALISIEMEEYAEEPSGLKVDKGFNVKFTPGIQGYQQNETEAALRTGATTNDKIRQLKIAGVGGHVIW